MLIHQQLAKVFGLTTPEIEPLAKSGLIPPLHEEPYDMFAAIRRYVAYLQMKLQQDDEGDPINDARMQLMHVQADKLQLSHAFLQGDMQPSEEVVDAILSLCVVYTTSVDSLSGRLAFECAGLTPLEQRKALASECQRIWKTCKEKVGVLDPNLSETFCTDSAGLIALLPRLKIAQQLLAVIHSRTPDQWADKHRILPPGSAEPGPWRSYRTPYMTPIVRACVLPEYKRVIAVMGSQMGKTAGLLNVIGQRLDDDPAPIIYVGPTRSNIEHVIEPKVMELLKQTPSLWSKLAKGKKLSKNHKRIAGTSLRLAWSGSPTELASDHAVLVLVDEIDRMSTHSKEGSVFELAEARTSTYADGKAIGTSTPTLGHAETFVHPQTKLEHWAVSDTLASPIWRLWQEGSRHEWAVPCPHCEEYFIPRFKHLTWDNSQDSKAYNPNVKRTTMNPDQARLTAKLGCPHCGGLIEDRHKVQMNKQGVYLAPGQSVENSQVIGEADTQSTDMATFWVSGLCSFSPKKTFGFLAKKWVAAYQSGEHERMQSVMNTDFGELYQVGGEAPAWTVVADRRLDYQQGELPTGANLLTAGVDVQQNRLVYVIRGWGLEYESWLIEQGELWGETDKPAVWQRLSALLQNQWQEKNLSITAIDTGYQTQMVYQFCRQHPGITLATKGHDTLDKPFTKTAVDVNRRGEVLSKSLSLWHFNTDQMKSWVHARIEWPADQPGGWWLPIDVSDDYCKQIVAEQRCVKPNGKITWVKVKKDNHYLDAEALAYLAIRILSAGRQSILSGEIPQNRNERRINHPGYSYEDIMAGRHLLNGKQIWERTWHDYQKY